MKVFDGGTLNRLNTFALVLISSTNLSALKRRPPDAKLRGRRVGVSVRGAEAGGHSFNDQCCRCIFFIFFFQEAARLLRDEAPRSAALFFPLTNLHIIEGDDGQKQRGKKAIMRRKGREEKETEKKSGAAHAIMCVRGRVTKRA